MGLKILCSGYLVRYPLGGHSWHHLQYLIGLRQLGHEVTFFEDYGWDQSCYDPDSDSMTSDPTYGLSYTRDLLRHYGLADRWCYLAEDGTAFGMPRAALAQICRDCDLYINLSNINWIPELEACRRRVLVDTDPVFTQIGAHGLGGPFTRYKVLFTYGENVHRPGCDMPSGESRWLPTRQPVVLDAWPVEDGDAIGPVTTVMNWSAEDYQYRGRVYGQKSREFEPYFDIPNNSGMPMAIALKAPIEIQMRLAARGWKIDDPRIVTRDPWTYQTYLKDSRAEFSVAKHGYVSTRCGWFSDRSAAYLAMGRPVIIQDTGFSDNLPCGEGLIAFRSVGEALAALKGLGDRYLEHCRAARALAGEHFDARRVLTYLLERSF